MVVLLVFTNSKIIIKYKGQIRYFDDDYEEPKIVKVEKMKESKEDPGKLSGSDFDRQADKEEPKGVSNAKLY